MATTNTSTMTNSPTNSSGTPIVTITTILPSSLAPLTLFCAGSIDGTLVVLITTSGHNVLTTQVRE